MYFKNSILHTIVSWLIALAALLLGANYAYLLFVLGAVDGSVPVLLMVRSIILVVTLLFVAVKLARLNARSRLEPVSELAVTKTFSWLFFITGVSYLPYMVWPTSGYVPIGDLLIILAWIIAWAALRRPRRSVLLAMTIFLLYVAWAHLAGQSAGPMNLVGLGQVLRFTLAPLILLYLIFGVIHTPWRLTPDRWPLYLISIIVSGGLIYAYGAFIDKNIVGLGQQQVLPKQLAGDVTDEQLKRVDAETLAAGDTPIKTGYSFKPEASIITPYDYIIRDGVYQLAGNNLMKFQVAASEQNPINNLSGTTPLHSADRRYVLTTGSVSEQQLKGEAELPSGTVRTIYTALYLNDLVDKQEHLIALVGDNWMVFEYLAMNPDNTKILFRGNKQQNFSGNGSTGSVGGEKKFYFIYDLPSSKATQVTWIDRAEFPHFYELDKPILGWDAAGIHIIAYDKKAVTGAVSGVRAGVYDINGKEQSRIPLVDGNLPNGIELNGILLGPKLYIASTYTTASRDYLVYGDGSQTTLNDKKIEEQYGMYSFYNASNVRYSSSTNKAYYFFSRTKEIKVIDVGSKQPAAAITVPVEISGLTVVNNGAGLLVDSYSNQGSSYYLVDLTTGAITAVK